MSDALAVALAELDVRRKRLIWAHACKVFGRLDALHHDGAESDADWENAKQAADLAQFDVEEAELRLKEAKGYPI